jgi:hypothetical protein
MTVRANSEDQFVARFRARSIRIAPSAPSSSMFLRSALGLWLIAVVGIVWILLGSSTQTSENRLYLVPWAIGLGIVTLVPAIYFYLRGKFDLFHPVVFPVWSYFFPGFALGGLILAAGMSQTHYLSFVQDETYNFPLTFFLIIVGFVGLVAGFSTPIGRKLGNFIARILPKWELSDKTARNGGLLLLLLGLINIGIAFRVGALGFQTTEEGFTLGGLILMSTLFWYQASFLLGLYVFRLKGIQTSALVILSILILTALINFLLVGSRAGLFHFLLPLIGAYFYSGRRIAFKHYVAFGLIVIFVLTAGIIYGTTFRNIRESQQAVSLDRYVAVVPSTISQILDEDPTRIFAEGFSTLATRIELVSSVAVVVSNYEALAPYEEELGIANNILVETSTFFIPRVIWNDKPVSVDPSKYADLYFNYSESSFTMTPIADLLRNFGVWGIPIGMFILGMLLRTVYVALIEGQGFSYWKLTLYYLLLTSISYDATYGGILPNLFRTAVVAILGFVIIWLITVRLSPAR